MMRRGISQKCILVTLLVMLGCPQDGLGQDKQNELPGAAKLAGELVRNHAYLFDEAGRHNLDEINRQLRDTESQKKKAAQEKLLALLKGCPVLIRVTIAGERITMSPSGPIMLPGDVGALLFRIEAQRGEPRCVSVKQDLAQKSDSGPAVEVGIGSSGTTWALIGLSNVPPGRSSLLIGLRDGDGHVVRLPLDIQTPQPGSLKVTILSADTGEPAPAMVRLVWKTDGRARKLGTVLELSSQLHGAMGWMDSAGGHTDGRLHANLPGRLKGYYWCVPGPFEMTLPPGQWEFIIRRGLEHVPVFNTFNIEPGQKLVKTYQPRRWVDMRKLGWYSGDTHVHCQILSDSDAKRLMTYAQAEDVHVSNILEMGDNSGTWFRQRGFGKDYYVIEDDYVLVPGQECPRTEERGHFMALNINRLVRDTSRYYLYDWVCDAVHKQGGLTGYPHVNTGAYHVHRGLSLDVPKHRIDFIELLQDMYLGTELYYDFLNLGFKLTAGAGSDVPWIRTLGEVRMYAYSGDKLFTPEAWFEAVKRGRTFVTNGPMVELHVDEAMPGDEIVLTENRKLRVRARAWGDRERVVPAKLEIIRHGDVIRTTEPAEQHQKELSLDFEIDSGDGFWIIARVEGSDGSRAHTTPVYVIREPLRFWKLEAADELIAKRMNSLDEIERIVADAIKQNRQGKGEDNRAIKMLALQGPDLLKSVAEARQVYEDLKQVAADQ